MIVWCCEAVRTCEILRSMSVKWYNCRVEELAYKPSPYTHALLYLLHDPVIIRYYRSFSLCRQSKYILYTSFWILYKLQYFYKDCLAAGAAAAGNGP